MQKLRRSKHTSLTNNPKLQQNPISHPAMLEHSSSLFYGAPAMACAIMSQRMELARSWRNKKCFLGSVRKRFMAAKLDDCSFHGTARKKALRFCWIVAKSSSFGFGVKLKEIYGHSGLSIYCKVVFWPHLSFAAPTFSFVPSNSIIYGLNCVYECPSWWVWFSELRC